MGLFKKLAGIATLGLVGDDPFKMFRTGATQAAKGAKVAGEESLAEQQALKEQIGGIYDPRIQSGEKAFGELEGFYGGDQQTIIDQAQASPFMSQLVNTGESAIARNAQMTGGFRSGTTQENLASNSQNVLMNLVQQILQGKEGIAQSGFGATDAYTTALQNIVAGTGATRGEIANIDVNRAAQRGNMIGGLVSGVASVGSALAGAPNITQTGTRLA
jgi:hypothetical protein